ncbi:sporulation domain-containing protein [Moraxella macacae 0408225]|uniref:Sporulation domain-containing protein n=1 Tax=Moraxella macacae 0408225 TaxID=1230338 RepID=L2F8A7_9GAMM|nr:SPOR domain-containing protein [Moraxella macacae]ELA09277.1 sporulation domain-containing protein [Moraxella macacae 0408225]
MMSKQGATPREPSNGMAIFAKILVGILLLILLGLFVYLWNPFHKATPNTTESPKIQPKTVQGEQPEYEFYEMLPKQQVTGVPTEPIASQPPIATAPDAIVINKNDASQTDDAFVATETVEKIQETDHTKTIETTTTRTLDSHAKRNNKSLGNTDNPITDTTDEIVADKIKENPMLGKRSETETSKKPVVIDAPLDKTYILQINSFDNAGDADRRRAEVLMAGVDAQIVKKRLEDGNFMYQVISRQMPNIQMATETQRRLQNNGIDSLIVEQRHK